MKEAEEQRANTVAVRYDWLPSVFSVSYALKEKKDFASSIVRKVAECD
jgi:hypothetical protein